MKGFRHANLFLLLALAAFTACQDIGADRPTIFERSPSSETIEPEVPTAPVRPSGAVIIQPGHCGCQDGEPITVGECAAICDSKPSSPTPKLYLSVEVTEEISLDIYQDFYGWCYQEISDAEGNTITGAKCQYEIMDEEGNVSYQDVTDVSSSSNNLVVDINDGVFLDDVTYRVTIIEATSGARSTTFQVRKYSSTPGSNIGGPLQYMPINRYACGIRNGGATSQDQNDFSRFHLYFNSQTRPEPLRQETVGSFFCHDLGPTGDNPPTNSPLLEETTGVFTLWDRGDPRFYDLDNDTFEDINNIIEREVKLQGAELAQTPRLFAELEWLSAFDDGDITPGDTSTSNQVQVVPEKLGYYMTPFLDTDTYRAYCPKERHYYQDSPLFKAMREVIAKDTEALYVAKQDNVCDFILINESVVEKIWFYTENGLAIKPTDSTIRGKKVQFYWPPADVAAGENPYIKKGHQRIYTIKSTEELTSGCSESVAASSTTGTNGNGVRTNIPPHDKRVGCIPVLSSGN